MKTIQILIHIFEYMFMLLNIEIIKLSNVNELCQSLLWGWKMNQINLFYNLSLVLFFSDTKLFQKSNF